MNVLLIDDDPDIADVVSICFEVGWGRTRVAVAFDGATGLARLWAEEPQLVVLDLGLPDSDGFEVLVEIRRHSNVPVIVLTVRGAEKDIARALDLGADDYVVKPFSHAVLLARAHAILRRTLSPGVAVETSL